MITQMVDPHHFNRRARQIKARIPAILSQWGLLPRFKRWRLAQDPGTGTVVLFGVLNTKYIATHTTTPFSDYFDPRLLRDMATELGIQVISSANDGLRYAFILERGQIGLLPEPGEILDHYAVYHGVQDGPIERRTAPPQPNNAILVDDRTILHQRLDRFLKIAEAIDEMKNITSPALPDVLLMDEAEFSQQIAEYEANRNHGNLQMS